MFGQCCFDVGDINLTMGTGSFIDVNTGQYAHASVAGKMELIEYISVGLRSITILIIIICCQDVTVNCQG